ncbi:MAG TPA: hypothetical protein VG028_21375 [Terriglobia bacterium]|nr:hypothetical protein [Terriglobia bacterium]
MLGKTSKLFFILGVILALGVVPSYAASAVVGSVAGGTNATIGGRALTPNTTLFSGDSLQVRDGAAVVAMGMGSRMVFGQETVASFERGTDEVTVTLGQGSVATYHPADGVPFRVKAGEVSVLAGKGYKSLGEVAMINGIVVVTAKDGTLKVEGPNRSMDLTKGQTIAITPKTARSPAPGQAAGAGAAASHMTTAQWVSIAGLGAGGVAGTIGIVDLHKINNTKALTVKADADALAADADAKAAAQAAANAAAQAILANQNAVAAGMLASQVCLELSPTNPNCAFNPGH